MVAKRKPGGVLTKLELEVMRVVWEAHPDSLTVRDVADRLNTSRSQPLAYTTFQTMMRILRDKGVLDSEPGPGRAHAYRALVTQEQATRTLVGDLLERLFDGKAQPLLQRLLDHQSLRPEELRDLRKLIDTQLGEDDG